MLAEKIFNRKIHSLNHKLRRKIVTFLLILINARKIKFYNEKHNHTELLNLIEQRNYSDEKEGIYESNNTTITIFKNYRYKTKATWKNFSGLAILDELKRKGLLDDKGIILLEEMIGQRTITLPIDEINNIAQRYVDRYPDLFIFKKVPYLGKRVLIPSLQDIERDVNRWVLNHKKILAFLQQHNLIGKSNIKILEIGYISGGESLVAFEKLGCEAHGIDYFYGGQFEGVSLNDFVRKCSKTNAQFHIGDITRETFFNENTFDMIFSTQTIEHIGDLKSAFNEMNRILKPGGIMYHSYDPYYHPMGGHSFGILDCPWGHVRLDSHEINKYLIKYRKYESDESIKWLRSSIHRTHTQSYVQSHLVESGFNVRYWHNELIALDQLSLLNGDIISDAFRIKSDLSIKDLVTRDIIFIAQKR
jgi:ubiquinone/menaquinone biosynthesis C-methylase UbiE